MYESSWWRDFLEFLRFARGYTRSRLYVKFSYFEKAKDILVDLIDRIRQLAFDIKPFLPDTSSQIEECFKGPKIKSTKPLFPRLKLA